MNSQEQLNWAFISLLNYREKLKLEIPVELAAVMLEQWSVWMVISQLKNVDAKLFTPSESLFFFVRLVLMPSFQCIPSRMFNTWSWFRRLSSLLAFLLRPRGFCFIFLLRHAEQKPPTGLFYPSHMRFCSPFCFLSSSAHSEGFRYQHIVGPAQCKFSPLPIHRASFSQIPLTL